MNQYLLYKLVPLPDGRTDKIPLSPVTGVPVSAHDPQHWVDYPTAQQSAAALRADGVALAITPPLWFIDIDHCLIDGHWSDLATSLVTRFAGAYVEVSSSGTGLHIIGSGEAPPHTCHPSDGLEFYTDKRFVALTGTHAYGSMEFDATALLPTFVAEYFPPILSCGVPQDDVIRPDDDALISRMLQSKSFLGTPVAALWYADVITLSAAYPATDGRDYDASSADAALAQHLAFWTGNDAERMERLMRMSALVRDKWERPDYLPRTIASACAKQKTFYTPSLTSEPIPAVMPAFLTLDDQTRLFQGCVYVTEDNKALIPGGHLLNMSQFRVRFGGHSFPMDAENNRVTRNAWEAFTEHQVNRYPQVDSTCFRPLLAPGAVIEEDDTKLVNTWWPVKVKRTAGNVTLFTNHISKLIRDERDATIFTSYLAALVQYPGIKFQWCPIVQGAEGNGKTLFNRVLKYAIGRRYTHFPKASELAGKFNDWMYRKIFIGVEDIFYDPRINLIEMIKTIITGEDQEIEPKGGARVTRDICCNFLINTNHKDGLQKTHNDRRFAPFYTAQQEKADLERDGLTHDYFKRLYGWLGKGGYAMCAEFLHTHVIADEFNPALGRSAPKTTSTDEAIAHSQTWLEQEIREAIAQELPGFRGGWISSMALNKLIKSEKVGHIKRAKILRLIGYVTHPRLPEGRVPRTVLPDGGRPTLYIHRERITDGDPTLAYEVAQRDAA